MLAPRFAGLFASCLTLGLAVACGSGDSTSTQTTAATCPELIDDETVAIESPPDGPAACAPGDCNYQTQDGCPDTQACRPQFNATDPEVHPGCEAAGTAASGEACQLQGDCARGLYCAAGACHKLCCGADWTACDAGESCIRSVDVHAGDQVLPANASLCFPVGTCDVFDANGCPNDPARECKIVDPTGAVACAPRSHAGLGDACAPPTVCQQGLNCVGRVNKVCIKLCRFAQCGDPACTADEGTCVHYPRDPEGVGECSVGR
ncbi:MAG TPA: hypothetical protein VNG33_20625 [Polyangiaceae bacterium]|nr:hypothetical protein [Polyangiaceae bacterium]